MLFEIKDEDIGIYESRSFDFPLHLHSDVEMLICTEGVLGCSCNGQERELQKGDIMICFPNDIHSYKETNHGKGIRIIFKHTISELITSILNTEHYHNFVHNDDVIPISQTMLNCMKNNNFTVLYGYLHVVFGKILKKSDTTKPSISTNTFNSAVRYISLNYTRKISLKSVASQIGVTPCHLSRMFTQKIYGGFKNYLMLMRVEKAKNLLKTTDINIYEASLESGFSDQRTFNRAFKNITGMTPKSYREKHSVYTHI